MLRDPAQIRPLAFEQTGHFSRSTYGLDGNGGDGLPRLTTPSMPGWTVFGGGESAIVHPGTTHDVTKVSGTFPEKLSVPPTIFIRFRIAAEGVGLVEGAEDFRIPNG